MYYKCLNNLLALLSNKHFSQYHYVSLIRSGCNRRMSPLCSTDHFKNDIVFFNNFSNCFGNLPVRVVNENSVSIFEKCSSCTDLSEYLHCNYVKVHY